MEKKIFNGQFGEGQTLKVLKKVYNRCKPAMLKKFGRILSFDEFCNTLSYAHENKLIK